MPNPTLKDQAQGVRTVAVLRELLEQAVASSRDFWFHR